MERILVYGMTDNRGGIEAYLMNMLRHLNRRQVIFDFVVDFPSMAYAEEAESLGSRIFYIPAKSKRPLAHLRGLRKIFKKHPEYRLAYFNIMNAGAAFSLLALPRRIKVWAHSHTSNDDNPRLHRFFQPLLKKRANRFLACSHPAALHMFGTEGSALHPVTYMNNAVSVAGFTFLRHTREAKRVELALPQQAFVLLHVGRMERVKNPFFLLDVFKEVLLACPGARLLYVGAGSLHREIVEYAQKLSLQNAVLFLGLREDIPALYSAADAFLLPSLYEGLPVTLIEAQAADLPCIVSDAVTRDAALTDRVFFLPLQQPALWAKKVLSLGEGNFLQRHNRQAALCAAGYDAEHEAKKLEQLVLADCSLLKKGKKHGVNE